MSDWDSYLPEDWRRATLVGRAVLGCEDPALLGPSVISVVDGSVFDLTHRFPTMAHLCAADRPAEAAKDVSGLAPVYRVSELIARSIATDAERAAPYLLAPNDLQVVKAAGVTFATSLLERIIEEKAGGDVSRATVLRDELTDVIGSDLSKIVPGSEDAKALERHLRAIGYWSQYLEVGIGPDAELFTKAPILSSVGFGAEIGLHPRSSWNNPEPEIVVVVAPDQNIVGASLGNDVNLRDFEGRSALLLGKAKDNNASCATGPFIRLFDAHFTLDDVRRADVDLKIEGADGYLLTGASTMREISRDVADLVAQTAGATHQYPDGFVLFTGTLFAPTEDRDAPGMGFTHKIGDRVSISSPKLGALVNTVTTSDKAAPWTFGVRALMDNLRARNVI